MKMWRNTFLLTLLLVSTPAWACINELGEEDRDITSDGRKVDHALSRYFQSDVTDPLTKEKGRSHAKNIDQSLEVVDEGQHAYEEERSDRWLREAQEEFGKSPSVKTENRVAVTLLRSGKPKEALVILEKMEKEHPNTYAIAANLGTAYELAGDDEKALKWIKEGIRRNPDSHEQSEWLHVRILEAKLALKKDPNWLKTHSVAGLDFGAQGLPVRPSSLPQGNDGKGLTLLKAYEGLGYQLSERLYFIKKDDPVVGDLLYDYGQGAFLLEGVQWSGQVLERTQELFPIQRQHAASRISTIKEYASNHKPTPPSDITFLAATVLAWLALSFAWWKSVQHYLKIRASNNIWKTSHALLWWGLSCAHGLLVTFSVMAAGWSFATWTAPHERYMWVALTIVALVSHVWLLRRSQRTWWPDVVFWGLGIFVALLIDLELFIFTSWVWVLWTIIVRARQSYLMRKESKVVLETPATSP